MAHNFKYSSGQILYYVNPFVFTIEMVQISFTLIEEDGTPFYIDNVGAYLYEWDLFLYLEDAKQDAVRRLKKFYQEKEWEILHSNPTKIVED